MRMKLKYKFAFIVTMVGLFILTTISFIYSNYSYNQVLNDERTNLISKAENVAYIVESKLKEKISIVKTMGSSTMLLNSLEKSNKQYILLNKTKQQNKIKKLNDRWLQAKNDEDSFIKPYLTNQLALYLKSQKKVLPGIYGEIFITNVYGAMIASTGKLSTLAHSHKYWWKEAYNNGMGKVFIDDRGFDKSVGGYVVGITIPIKKDNKIIGILKANVNIIGSLNNIVTHYSKLNYGILKIARTKGLVVLEQNKTPLSTKVNEKLLKDLKNMNIGSKVLDNNIISFVPIKLTSNSSEISFGSKPNKKDHIEGNQNEAWHIAIVYSKKEALTSSKKLNEIILYIGMIVTVILLFISFLLAKWISSPINKLSEVANRIGQGEHNLRAEENGKDEIAVLARSFNTMLEDLNSTTTSRDELILEIDKRKKAQSDLKEQEEIMIIQSKQAAMGEMISMIAHQWRQPLAVISMDANTILADIELEMVNNETLTEVSNEIIDQTQELTKIIDDFKDFFKPIKHSEFVTISSVLDNALNIVGKSLVNNDVECVIDNNSTVEVEVYSRELMQVFINIINNAKEILVENEVKEKRIKIDINDNKNNVIITIADNGGGIKDNILNKLFDPYFSTKKAKNGTGLGLYMSKMIIEKHLYGAIRVYNKDDGAVFEIELQKKLENKESV